MSKISKAAKSSKTPEETSGWKPRIAERPLPSGNTAWQADWWEKKPGGGYSHKKKQKATRAELDAWLADEHTARSREARLVRDSEKRGDNVVTLANLSPAERAALAQAIETIRAAGGRVEAVADAATFYKATHLQGAKKTVAEIVAEHLAEIQARRRPATLIDRRRNLAPLVDEYGESNAATITRATARDWIFAANTPSMQAARKRALHALFSFAEEKGYMEGNPVAKIKVESPVRDEVSILSPKDAEEVLRRAEKHAPAIVPYVAIGLFAGLRPMNELRGLDWKDIDLTGKRIMVSRASSKTNRARPVPISPNLAAWLDAVPKSRRKGRVFYSRRLLDRITGREPQKDKRIKRPGKITKAAEKAGKKKARKKLKALPWGQDIMRHTRTSYRMAETKNAPLVAEEGGHTQQIMKLHYTNQRITDAAVKEFWNIMPTRKGN